MIIKISNRKVQAEYQLYELDEMSQDNKILAAIRSFEHLDTRYKNIHQLDYNLFELKPKGGLHIFNMILNADRRIIIIGFITLKKTQ